MAHHRHCNRDELDVSWIENEAFLVLDDANADVVGFVVDFRIVVE
jgi:hypothetical protein